MTSRLQIARARARVALAELSGEPLPDSVRAIAAEIFADADDAIPASESPNAEGPPRRFSFALLVGVHASGRDFGPLRRRRSKAGRDLTDDEREFLNTSSFHSRAEWSVVEAEVARGESDDLERRTDHEAMSAALSVAEAANWLDVGTGRVLTDLAFGDLFAFVCDNELRFPAWQFTDDPAHPVLDHLSWLAAAFDDAMYPASILCFMTTPHADTPIAGQPVTPVEWLTAHRDVQPLLQLLRARRRT
ncbi:hypothetical protein [Curtobacterium sp. MCBA15_012]|uniref:hypothetical protein n=1 Tax=Curtobacterium sp. MCBA15_012 TaxID=1898738 RepID=UPI0008DE0996|nr:hypothetical protein [Curtobacterium sp. MCBA15_012]WIB00355.1 hypothetical protein QOL15_01310 [Curtobacterium sp. MCBA15_012]